MSVSLSYPEHAGCRLCVGGIYFASFFLPPRGVFRSVAVVVVVAVVDVWDQGDTRTKDSHSNRFSRGVMNVQAMRPQGHCNPQVGGVCVTQGWGVGEVVLLAERSLHAYCLERKGTARRDVCGRIFPTGILTLCLSRFLPGLALALSFHLFQPSPPTHLGSLFVQRGVGLVVRLEGYFDGFGMSLSVCSMCASRDCCVCTLLPVLLCFWC